MNTQPTLGRLGRAGLWAGIAVVTGVFSAWLAMGGPLQNVEQFAGDLLFRLRGPLTDETSTFIVAIDEASFEQSGYQWPWPRDYLALIIDHIAEGKPKAIAIDIFLYEATDPAKDRALGEAIRRAGNVIVVNDISTQAQAGTALEQLNHPIPEIEKAVAAQGLTNFNRDSDGVVRRLLAFQSHNDQLYYSWAMQTARMYFGAEDFDVISANRVDIDGRPVRLAGQFLRVNFRGPAGTIPTVSAYQVASGLFDPSKFEGKVVLLGATTESLHDSYPTPFGSQPPTPGVEVNANAIETILTGQYVTRASTAAAFLLAIAAALVGITLAVRMEPRRALPAALGIALIYAVGGLAVFMLARLILPLVGPAVGVILTFVTGITVQLYTEQRKRAQVQGLFERYVAPAAIDQMLTQPETYASGGQRKELTVLFSDIRGFTTLSEGLSPDDVVVMLNEYLALMTELIFEHEGTIDKFEGDAILAIWNAPLPVPDHATKAVECGMAMIKALERLQETWAKRSDTPLRIGVGINTGQAFVGNIGSARRMDYTVIGDTVNLAARLQDLTKAEGTPILFSEATRDQLRPEIATRFVAKTQVKGRAQAVNMYTVEEPPGG